VELSYDDGATWRVVTLEPTDGGWRTKLAAPSTARYATLRTTARDDQDNRVQQTIIRAVGLG
jgi:hypothetical protein